MDPAYAVILSAIRFSTLSARSSAVRTSAGCGWGGLIGRRLTLPPFRSWFTFEVYANTKGIRHRTRPRSPPRRRVQDDRSGQRPVTLPSWAPSPGGRCRVHRKGGTMEWQPTPLRLGVESLDRSKAFYADGLGCAIEQDYPGFVRLDLGEGSSSLALYERGAAAADAGVSPEGSGFRGVSFHYIVPDGAAVDEIMMTAIAAGGEVVKEAEATNWGYF